jgi:two-component system response regulator MprA
MVLGRVAESQREESPRVLIVDDDEALLAALDLALTRRGFRIVTAREAGEAFGRLEDAGQVDLIVLDVMMPGMDGVTLCRLLRDRTLTPMLMLTARDAVADRIAGLEAGADDYLQKPFDLDELVARLLALRRRALRNRGAEGVERTYEDITLDSRTWSARRTGRNLGLTPTEFRILEQLLQSPESVRRREDLMRAIWGENWVEADSGTLEVHIANLRQKLERGGGSRLIHTIRGVGYVLKA